MYRLGVMNKTTAIQSQTAVTSMLPVSLLLLFTFAGQCVTQTSYFLYCFPLHMCSLETLVHIRDVCYHHGAGWNHAVCMEYVVHNNIHTVFLEWIWSFFNTRLERIHHLYLQLDWKFQREPCHNGHLLCYDGLQVLSDRRECWISIRGCL